MPEYQAPAPPQITYSPDGQFWWDGQKWRPVHAPMGSQPTATKGASRAAGILLFVGAGLVILGTIFPWATITISAPVVGAASKSLLDGGDGIVYVLAAGLACFPAYKLVVGRAGKWSVIAMVAAVVTLALMLLLDIPGALKLLGDSPLVSLGTGFYVELLGVGAVVVATVLAIAGVRSARRSLPLVG